MLEKILKNIKTILIILGVLSFMLFLNQCNETKKLKKEIEAKEKITAQNLAALNDSIKVYKAKSGLNSYSKPIAEMNSKDIEKYFPDLYKRLKDEMGDVKIIWKTKIEYRDTGSVKNAIVKLDSNKFSLTYNYFSKDSSVHIKSNNIFYAEPFLVDKEKNKYSVRTKSDISTIEELSVKLGFSTGIKQENGIYKIFITPDNNNVIVSEIKGADVSSMLMQQKPTCKTKKWSIGPYIGFGVTLGKNSYSVGPGVGFSLQYSLISF